MFISNASFSEGIVVSVGTDPNECIRLGLGDSAGLGIYLTRVEALDLYSQLEKAIHKTGEQHENL